MQAMFWKIEFLKKLVEIQGYLRHEGNKIHPFIVSSLLQTRHECRTDTSVLDWKLRVFRDSGDGRCSNLGLMKNETNTPLGRLN